MLSAVTLVFEVVDLDHLQPVTTLCCQRRARVDSYSQKVGGRRQARTNALPSDMSVDEIPVQT